ncbi:hypothetical protein HYPSUDRAFT_44007 [Hypholoma sublateritium FD-334 SS-4]|uniref:Serine aminopeptidase S33 domain-containing protein n=1 Tax=Hypholoma sublateritium (strain FD-334 SS-4) TaxID=945553 RepID=A0A0D2M8U3_HYPSF|nr:hypothetical protein HYPSUDRAFT_44007 [Hypholoma sublateritium FD-334 SS-4]
MGLFWKLLRHGQRLLVYPAGFLDSPTWVDTPSSFSMPYVDITLTTKDKISLHCYLVTQPEDEARTKRRGTVIMCHGNAMNHGHILHVAQLFYVEGFDVFTLEYRGYGNNEGSPSEKGLQRDAQAAMDFVSSHVVLSQNPIIVFGQSLGGAIAIDVTSRNASKVSALIVENTFTSIPDIVKGLPVLRYISCLCTQRWNSQSKVARLPASLPILMLSGLIDQVVPPVHMQKLWKTAESRLSKGESPEMDQSVKSADGDTQVESIDKMVTFPRGTHNGTCLQSGYNNAIIKFLERHIPPVSDGEDKPDEVMINAALP